jgi:DNA-binding MarR family transcriptional regulator
MASSQEFVKVMHAYTEIFMHNSMRNFILFSKESGLSMSQIGALFRIQKSESAVSDLSDELGVTPAAASQMLERLFQQNLVLRSEDPKDRRAKRIVLTEKGQKLLKDAIYARQKWLDELAEKMTDAEREKVVDALHTLILKAKQSE